MGIFGLCNRDFENGRMNWAAAYVIKEITIALAGDVVTEGKNAMI